jgi:DNA repair exonuclease SbcCD ATPase subunit
MIKIKSIKIQGFKSFSKKQIFTITEDSGFYYIYGENLVEPELESNGAGKSTLGDALCFCFFGKTSNNLIASNIANWNEKYPCEITVNLEKNNIEYSILRTWKPNLLKVNDEIFSQEQLEDLIGYNFKSFLYSVVVAQFSSKFFDLDPSDKMDIFSEIMEDVVSKWEDFSEYTKTKLDNTKIFIDKKQNEIISVESKIQLLNNQKYKEQIEQWGKEHEEEVEDLQKEINNIGKSISQKETELLLNNKLIETNNSKLYGVEKTLKEIIISRIKIFKQLDIIKNNKGDKSYLLKDINKQIDKFLNLSTNTLCPTCEEPIKKEKIKKYIDELNSKRKEVEDSLKELNFQLTKLEVKQEEVEEQKETAEKEKNNLNLEIKGAERDIINLKNIVKTYKEDISSQIDYLSSLKKKENPYKNMEEKNNKKKNFLNRKLIYFIEELNILKNNYELYKYWVKGFKEIRFMVISEAIKELEVNINNNLSKLNMKDWYIELDVDSITKKNTVKKGFSVLVKSPINNKLVPFSVWSGGEGQRLRLAGTLGLIDFINSRRGIDCNIEVWDEPTQWLSKKGIDDLLDVLKERSSELNKNIYLIDHRDLDSSGIFSGSIKIIKTKQGSIIEGE